MTHALVRSGIVVFGLLCVGIVVLNIVVGEPNHYEKLGSLSARIDANPTPDRLRDLLNYPADGAYSYYQMALIGASFSKHPDVFRAVSEDLQTDQESRGVELLASLGAGVFEYHPDLKPAAFDQQFRDQRWITQTQGEQSGAGQPATTSESK